jgi:hypothetical protein
MTASADLGEADISGASPQTLSVRRFRFSVVSRRYRLKLGAATSAVSAREGQKAMFKTSEPFKMNISNATVIEIAVHLGVIGFLAYWTFTLILPFAPVVLWSVVLTVALYPVFDWLAQKLQGRRRLAAALLTLLGLLVVIGPVTWLGIGLVEGGRELVARVNEGQLSVPPPSEGVKDWPLVGPLFYDYWARASTNLASVLSPLLPQLRPVGETLLGAAGSAGMGTLKFLASVIIDAEAVEIAQPAPTNEASSTMPSRTLK